MKPVSGRSIPGNGEEFNTLTTSSPLQCGQAMANLRDLESQKASAPSLIAEIKMHLRFCLDSSLTACSSSNAISGPNRKSNAVRTRHVLELLVQEIKNRIKTFFCLMLFGGSKIYVFDSKV